MITIKQLIREIAKKHPHIDTKVLMRAYEYASTKCGGMKRYSGDPCVTHPLSTVKILIDFTEQQEVFLAALLHYVPRIYPDSIAEIRELFGEETSSLIEGVVRLAHVKIEKNNRQLDSLRNMFLAMASDIRVVIIKLACRLHNMRTLQFLPPDAQKDIAQETLYVYAPIANRLGIYALKGPLEDLSFFYLFPKEHHDLSVQMSKHEPYRDRVIKQINATIKGMMKEHGINGVVSGRIKHLYSIYQKIKQKRKESVDDVYDIFAIRITVDTVADCYGMLGIIHEHYVPIGNRFKDYIAVPKPNGYRSLHTTVIGLSRSAKKTFPVEIQIRTKEMNQEAEFGIAAHWHYKEKAGSIPKKSDYPRDWVDGLADMEDQLKESPEFMEEVSEDSFNDRIYAITPNGEIKDLPLGACPIDFAFAVHSDIGRHMRLAKVNKQLVPLDYKIKSGDIIEIITSKDAKPNQNWLAMCTTSKAKHHIRSFLNKKDSNTLIREGREILNRLALQQHLPELDQTLSVLKQYKNKTRNKRQREELLLRVGNGSLSANKVIHDIANRFPVKKNESPLVKKKSKTISKKENEEVKVIIGESHDIPLRMGSCCKPKPGDKIVGFVTRGAHVTIHRTDCKTLTKLDPRRLISARFETEKAPKKTVLSVHRGADRVGFVHDILTVFANHNANLTGFSFEDRSSVSAHILFTIEFDESDQLQRIIEDIKKVDGTMKVREKKQ